MRTSYLEIFVDHERNLPSTETLVFHLGVLLLHADLLLEAGIMSDLPQGGRNLRIKHLKNRESVPSN